MLDETTARQRGLKDRDATMTEKNETILPVVT